MLRGFLCMWLIYMYWIFFVLTTYNKACACCFCSVLSLCTYIMCFLHLYSVERGILKGGNQSSLTHADLYRKHNITQGRNCVQLNRASENGSGVTVSTCASLFYQKTKQKSPSLVDYFDLLELSWSWQVWIASAVLIRISLHPCKESHDIEHAFLSQLQATTYRQ